MDRLKWEDTSDDLVALARFFSENTDPAYISEGEVTSGRALDMYTWDPQLEERMVREFRDAVDAANEDLRLAVARAHGEIVGLCLVESYANARVRCASISDLVIDRARRGKGIGGGLLAWVEARLSEEGVRRIFLESGIHNESAHDFFTRKSYAACAKIFTKELPAEE